MDKPVVYLRDQCFPPEVGRYALVKTIDHPSPLVTNWPQGDGWVATSNVIKVYEDGFETLNTMYQKHPELFIG